MSFIGDDSGGEDAAARTSSDLRKPFLHTGSWYRMAAMGSRQSSLMDQFSSSAAVIRDSAVSVVLCTLIVALGPVQFGFTCGFSSPTQDDIIRDLGLTLSEVDRAQHSSLFFSINFLFLITNCLICGRERICFSVFGIWIVGERWSYGRRFASGQIAEYIGRKGSLMIASIPNIIGWLAVSFAKDSSFLYLGRLLEGFGVGVISYVVPVYIAEIAPQNMRGALGSVNQLSVTIGVMIAYLLGLFVQWRVLAVLVCRDRAILNSDTRSIFHPRITKVAGKNGHDGRF